MTVLNFEENGPNIGTLLEEHEQLHRKVAAFDAHGEGEHTAAEHEQLSDAIRANIHKLLVLIGLPGARGLIHVAHEMIDDAAHEGLNLTRSGEFVEEADGQAWMDILADINEIERLLVLTSQHRGKLPADHEPPDGPGGPMIVVP